MAVIKIYQGGRKCLIEKQKNENLNADAKMQKLKNGKEQEKQRRKKIGNKIISSIV